MNSKFAIAVASSLCTLLLMTGVADAKGGGNSGGASSQRSSSAASTPSRITEVKKTEPRTERRDIKVTKIEPKPEPKVERRMVERRIVKTEDKPSQRVNKVALNPQPLPPKEKMHSNAKVLTAAVATAGAAHLAANKVMTHRGAPTAPLADRHHNVSSASMAKFVASNAVQRNVKTITPADGVAKHREAVTKATVLIKDPSKGYQVATYGDKTKPGQPGKPAPQGDNSTIVINENNKTVYVPASTVAGPDRRTIIVNCSNCKVVIVGDTSKNGAPVVDQRNIVVNGSHDKIVLQGDKANGGTGQAGGSVTDSRHVTVNGDKNNIKVQGDSVNGGNGANSGTGRGQDGGNGGKVTDNRTVDISQSGDKNRVSMGGDSANGGNGGNGTTSGGNGGTGGGVTDHRAVNDQGHKNKVDTSRDDSANGGNGGSGQPAP
jgi:hypothetical protein